MQRDNTINNNYYNIYNRKTEKQEGKGNTYQKNFYLFEDISENFSEKFDGYKNNGEIYNQIY
jgi:hypothetical protein